MKDPLDRLIYRGNKPLPECDYSPKSNGYTVFNIHLSHDQMKTLNDAPMGVTLSQYVRNLIRGDFEADGLNWPHDIPDKRGKHSKRKVVQR